MHISREVRTDGIQLADDILVFFFRVHLVFELDIDDSQTVVYLRTDPFDVIHLIEPFFDRVHDQFFHILGARAGVNNDGGKLRSLYIRVFAPGHVQERVHANGRQHHKYDERELIVLY